MFKQIIELLRLKHRSVPAILADVPLSLPPRPRTQRRAAGVPTSGSVFFVPMGVIEETAAVMRRFGREQRECYVWWGGYVESSGMAQVLTAVYPEIPTKYGHVQLNQRQLGALQQKLRELDQVLLVELHTHPPMAGGQNEVDAAHPAAPYPGFISVVVPSFGFVNVADLRESSVYEYIAANCWRTLDTAEVATRFIVEPDLVQVVPSHE